MLSANSIVSNGRIWIIIKILYIRNGLITQYYYKSLIHETDIIVYLIVISNLYYVVFQLSSYCNF